MIEQFIHSFYRSAVLLWLCDACWVNDCDGIGLFSAVQVERRRSISQATTYINDWLIYSQLRSDRVPRKRRNLDGQADPVATAPRFCRCVMLCWLSNTASGPGRYRSSVLCSTARAALARDNVSGSFVAVPILVTHRNQDRVLSAPASCAET